jgi:hypothetical protein
MPRPVIDTARKIGAGLQMAGGVRITLRLPFIERKILKPRNFRDQAPDIETKSDTVRVALLNIFSFIFNDL